jgi:hypothetical protein
VKGTDYEGFHSAAISSPCHISGIEFVKELIKYGICKSSVRLQNKVRGN